MTALAARESIQRVIVFPQQIHRGWYYVPKQSLLFTPTGVVHLLASIWPTERPRITHLKGRDLLYIKVTLILLYGFLEIHAQDQGLPAQLGMEFNTVSWHYLSSPLQQFLGASKAAFGMLANKASCSPSLQTDVERLPFKFSNGLKIYGLLPGEELEELVFQPGTWKRWRYFFRQPISANTLLLLTTN